jgi:glycosyltransferase involved in cell wall biosynthesis
MKILLIHQNYPAQFRHLAPELASRGHQVLALTSEHNQRKTSVPTLRYRIENKAFSSADYGLAAHFAEHSWRGQIVARAAEQLKANGFVPDLVFGHSGWGETLFLGEVWPAARRLVYAEFFYRPHGLDVDFDPEFRTMTLEVAMRVRSRQASHLFAVQDAHAALSPTEWQASSFPEPLRQKISVIHDGIDTDLVAPSSTAEFAVPDRDLILRPGDEVLTFVNRNLEPYRGYHVFMRALPAVLASRPKAHAVIVGGDGLSYGPPNPGGASWKQRFLAEVQDRLDLSRVHFVGRIAYEQFVALMQVSRVHAYLSYPFVLSWSMLEAMSAGALVVGSNTPPVAEVIRDGENGRLVEFFDTEAWSNVLIDSLARPDEMQHMRRAGRQAMVERYDVKRHCLPRQVRFVEGS